MQQDVQQYNNNNQQHDASINTQMQPTQTRLWMANHLLNSPSPSDYGHDRPMARPERD